MPWPPLASGFSSAPSISATTSSIRKTPTRRPMSIWIEWSECPLDFVPGSTRSRRPVSSYSLKRQSCESRLCRSRIDCVIWSQPSWTTLKMKLLIKGQGWRPLRRMTSLEVQLELGSLTTSRGRSNRVRNGKAPYLQLANLPLKWLQGSLLGRWLCLHQSTSQNLKRKEIHLISWAQRRKIGVESLNGLKILAVWLS